MYGGRIKPPTRTNFTREVAAQLTAMARETDGRILMGGRVGGTAGGTSGVISIARACRSCHSEYKPLD